MEAPQRGASIPKQCPNLSADYYIGLNLAESNRTLQNELLIDDRVGLNL